MLKSKAIGGSGIKGRSRWSQKAGSAEVKGKSRWSLKTKLKVDSPMMKGEHEVACKATKRHVPPQQPDCL